jgi:hypothetical protein
VWGIVTDGLAIVGDVTLALLSAGAPLLAMIAALVLSCAVRGLLTWVAWTLLVADQGCTVLMCPVPKPENVATDGWDIADAIAGGWTAEDVRAFIRGAHVFVPPDDAVRARRGAQLADFLFQLVDLFLAVEHVFSQVVKDLGLQAHQLGAFYMDGAQVPVIVEKFRAYTSAGLEATNYTIYSLLSKWGRVDLGSYTGGVKLFFDEALAGLITWSIAAPLFAVNRVFMTAYFQRDKAPIRHFFSRAGAVELGVNLIHVMRWGLWMSPIINTGLRLMGQATWYNQDGAIRTLIASFKSLTLSPGDFQAWSLGVFVSLLAFDFLRILIWVDHMGLRVATLVNLSFLGMDKLDEKIARFIGPAAAQRYLPEGVKRFTTWAPLLIPFYLPRGENWDFAWAKSIEIQNAATGGGLTQAVLSLEWHHLAGLFVAGVLLMSALSATLRAFLKRASRRRPASFELSNPEYKVSVLADGGGHNKLLRPGYDLSRRSYDRVDPAGRALFLVDAGSNYNCPMVAKFLVA